jgi:membrane dipeptidase
MRQANIALCFATTVSRFTGRPLTNVDWHSREACYGAAQSQLAYYRALQTRGLVRVITTRAALDTHMAEWQKPDTSRLPIGFFLSMESADPILSPSQLPEWWDAGIRAIGPAHYGPGVYAHGTGSRGGLTPVGRELVAAMKQLHFVLDLTHLDDPAFWETLEIFDGPVLASHQNCRVLVPGQRQFTDEQLRAVIERDGVIGAAFDDWMLSPGFVIGTTPNTVAQIKDVVDHIDRVCQLAGNANHAAIGSDLDGGFGLEQSPCDLDTIADLQKLPALLGARGYKPADIEQIMHGNWLRFLRRVL